VADACRDYLDFIGERRKSAADIETRIEAFVIPKLGAIEASKLTADAINKWLAGLAKTPPRVRTKKGAEQQHRQLDDSQEARRRRQATANRIWTSLRAALNRAFKARRIGSDTEWRRVEAFRDVDAARERLLTVAECKRLANASAPDFRRLLRAGLATGARYSELADLLVSDFNGEAVHIRKSKNGKERWIHLNPEGVALFKSLAAGKAPNALLLTRDDGERWAKNYQQVPMAAACKNGNVTPCGFHQLRHCYASWAVMGGMPLVALAKNLGHANTKMVEKHYGHLAKDYLTEITKATAPTFGFKSSRVRAIR
jgi:integrase